MSDDADLFALLDGALLPSPGSRTVELVTEQGRELLCYSDSGNGHPRDCGTLFISADTPENRRRSSITSHCPMCPDLNQGMTTQDMVLGPEGETYTVAAYSDCGHAAVVRLDEEGELYFLAEGCPPPW